MVSSPRCRCPIPARPALADAAVIGWIGRGVLIVTAVAGLGADCAAAVICVPGWTRVALVLPIVGRFGKPVVGLLGADAVPGLGLWRQDEAGVPQQAVGDQLRGPLPALRVAAAPPGVMLQRTGQDHARQRGLDVIGIRVRHPLRRVANVLAVAGQGLAGFVGADRQP